jgi:hypothetical protein
MGESFARISHSFLLCSRDSGVGDFGVKGIKKWWQQHDCNASCKNLELEVGNDDEEDD